MVKGYKIFMTEKKLLNAKGEADYDFENDILFFKVKNREYEKSVELDRFAIDIDDENFVVGMQIFEASKFLGVPKEFLCAIKRWAFQATVAENRLEIRLMFQVLSRNRVIEKNPIIIEPLKISMPNSNMMCKVG